MMPILIPAAVAALTLLLLVMPLALPPLRRNMSFLALGAAWCVSLSVFSLVTCLVALGGWGALAPLRVVAVLGALAAIASLGIYQRGDLRLTRRAWLVAIGTLVVVTGIGMLELMPVFGQFAQTGVTLGLATVDNHDIDNYLMAADNIARSGYTNSNHILNVDYGQWGLNNNYMGATTLLLVMPAITGLEIWQTAMAAMVVAVGLMAVSLAALTESLWPGRPRAAAIGGVLGVSIPLSSYVIGNYFLGSVLGIASLAVVLAGLTTLARDRDKRAIAMLAIVAGTASGIYCYPVLMLPALIALPIWLVVVWISAKNERRPSFRSVVVVGALSLLAALIIASPSRDAALALLQLQSDQPAGWSMPFVASVFALIAWPGNPPDVGLLAPISWLVVFALAAAVLAVVAKRGHRTSALLTGLLLLGIATALTGAGLIYGTDRYQFWKLMSFIVPLGVAACWPPVYSLFARGRSVREISYFTLIIVVAFAVLTPFGIWARDLSKPRAWNPYLFSTSQDLVSLANNQTLANLNTVNVLMSDHFQTMSAGAILPTPSIVLSGPSYFLPLADANTCTLVANRDAEKVPPAGVIRLNKSYSLIPFPAPCR